MPRIAENVLTDEPVLNRILDLLKEKGITEKALAAHLGLKCFVKL